MGNQASVEEQQMQWSQMSLLLVLMKGSCQPARAAFNDQPRWDKEQLAWKKVSVARACKSISSLDSAP